jgi:hypothetical protein
VKGFAVPVAGFGSRIDVNIKQRLQATTFIGCFASLKTQIDIKTWG